MNIKNVARNVIQNYDESVQEYIRLLTEIGATLVYNGPGLQECIFQRTVYACSIMFTAKTKRKNVKYLNDVLPILIGSQVDMAIRKHGFTDYFDVPNIVDGDYTFETPDIALTCFVINGTLRQIPFFITTDPTNPHVIRKSIVRLYRYDSDIKGKELSFYMSDETFEVGALVVKLNNGEIDYNIDNFFEECPYPVDMETYFRKIFKDGFKIDSLENRQVISPGQLFLKLFVKNLYVPLRNNDQKEIVSKYKVVSRSILNGDILHIISKKTSFYNEHSTQNKIVNGQSGEKQHREIGSNGQVFVEKKSSPYRDINTQIFPIIPYLSHFTNLQISNKVKTPKALCFDNSNVGFLCLYGTPDTKNVGRTMMLTRDTFVSTREDVGQVYIFLDLEAKSGEDRWVVINSACIPVSRRCFENINLLQLKKKFVFIECYEDNQFKFINYKARMIFKKLDDTPLWVTSRDMMFWSPEKDPTIFANSKGHSFHTSYYCDLLPRHNHNNYPKNVLALNSLKNAILSNEKTYNYYFCDTVSAFTPRTDKHQIVLEPDDEFSKHFALYLPQPKIMYASFKGCTQEDSIVLSKDYDAFDCYRLYTIKIKFPPFDRIFRATTGDESNPTSRHSFLGTLTCPEAPIDTSMFSQTMHLLYVPKTDSAYDVYFSKPGFVVKKFFISPTFLFIFVEQFHKMSSGDKLCSMHGQKGIVSVHDKLPYAIKDGVRIQPDIIANPYGMMSRQTLGQLIETQLAGGKDHIDLFNSDGDLMKSDFKTFIGPTLYFPIAFLAHERLYVVQEDCTKDKIFGQPVRGRSRCGGMKTGNMEHGNGYRANGLAACCEEVMLESSDRIVFKGIPLPQACVVCIEDAKCWKCNIDFQIKPSICPID